MVFANSEGESLAAVSEKTSLALTMGCFEPTAVTRTAALVDE